MNWFRKPTAPHRPSLSLASLFVSIGVDIADLDEWYLEEKIGSLPYSAPATTFLENYKNWKDKER